MLNKFEKVTKQASKTFYTASLFFPKSVRNDVFILYSFVRIADDYVDSVPPRKDDFLRYKRETFTVFDGKGKNSNDYIIAFVDLAKRKQVPRSLIEDYFKGQHIAIKKRRYHTYTELQEFMYGVAEVIGLMMCYVLDIPKKAHASAVLLGRAMQLVNILRDVDEDQKNGYVYLPQDELARFGLPKVLNSDVIHAYPQEYKTFMEFQTKRVMALITKSRKGFAFIPKKHRLPISVSAELYEHITQEIAANPEKIFRKRIKPTSGKIFLTVAKQIVM